MYCGNCGAEIGSQNNFCPNCGNRLENASLSSTLLNKAAYTAQAQNRYNLVLISRGTCDAVTAGDLLEDVFGYTDAESGNLVRMSPVVVGENMTADEASTVAQMCTEYGMQVSITDDRDQYVDLSSRAVSSVFDLGGNLLSGAAAVISSLTVANRISSYRRFKKPSLLERLFHINYTPAKPPVHHRNFRVQLDPKPVEPRRVIRRPMPAQPAGRPMGDGMRMTPPPRNNNPMGMNREPAGMGGRAPQGNRPGMIPEIRSTPDRGGMGGHGGQGGKGGHGGPNGGRR